LSAFDDIGFAFIYFDHKPGMAKFFTPVQIIGSLLNQLLKNKLSEQLSKREIQSCPTFTELSHILEMEVRSFSMVFIVFDALDECSEQGDMRIKVLNLLRGLPKLRLMITCRPHVLPVLSRFERLHKLDIHARDDDIRKYVNTRIDDNENLEFLCRQNQDLRGIILSGVIEKARGM
jgi:hypothetical protein